MQTTHRDIYCDIDGVLSDLMGHLVKYKYLRYIPTSYTIDINFRDLTQEFWATMPIFSEVVLMLVARKQAGYKDTIITKVSSEDEIKGKYRFLERAGLTNILPVMTHFCPRHELVNDRVVLVDDCYDNVRQWREQGGSSRLWLQPWSFTDLLIDQG